MYEITATIHGTETVPLCWGRNLSAIECAANVARLLADYDPSESPSGDPFETSLVSITIAKSS
jgi:hypothetical protein